MEMEKHKMCSVKHTNTI